MGAVRNLTFAIVLLAGLGAGCTSESEDAPLQPSYELDVKPIMGARCIRCHGAGGTLNADPDIAPIMMMQAPKSTSDFATVAPSDPNGIPPGLANYIGPAAGLFMSSIDTLPMPPPPSSPLSDRERTILDTWSHHPLP